ncbi:hypothetical protein BTJ68_00037 [Hortaea werneckii EXF-2000]|uniref:UBC core domain-containing protein n=2 Tax=Hortaea werneckii TaxID=91943 RepID=A0A3M7IKJ3_HORWE|nr:hypothetical protein BTJ68_00037 [Hortaea werneckii EXF-2000]RMZ26051.1 hypothetical protein D0859_09899 [Hortaea werneckii]
MAQGPQTTLMKRIMRERRDLRNLPSEVGHIDPAGEYEAVDWVGSIAGPPDTPYAGGHFPISIHFPESYPQTPFRLTLSVPVYHPHISKTGEVWLAELQENEWSPALTARSVLVCLQAMLSDARPVRGCVLNEEAAALFLEDVAKFETEASRWTAAYAVR